MSGHVNQKLREIEFCIDNGISQAQYTFLYILYRIGYASRNNRQVELKEIIRIHKKYVEYLVHHKVEKIEVDFLIENGFVTRKGNSTRLTDFTLTEKFTDRFMNAYVMIDQLWNLYPGFLSSEGKNFVLKAADKQEIGLMYVDRINNERKEHEEVLKDIRYGIDHNLINFGIQRFVEGYLWNDIRAVRLKQAAKNKNKDSYGGKDL